MGDNTRALFKRAFSEFENTQSVVLWQRYIHSGSTTSTLAALHPLWQHYIHWQHFIHLEYQLGNVSAAMHRSSGSMQVLATHPEN
eukprot:gene8211-1475_t